MDVQIPHKMRAIAESFSMNSRFSAKLYTYNKEKY